MKEDKMPVELEKQIAQEEEMHEVNQRLYRFIDSELAKTTEPHIVGGVLAAALQNLWVTLMGREGAVNALRQMIDYVENETADHMGKRTLH